MQDVPVAGVPVLLVEDTAALIQFYTTVLGFQDVDAWGKQDPETPRGMLRYGATSCGVSATVDAQTLPEQANRTFAMALVVVDLEAAHARIATRVPERVGPIIEAPWGAHFDVLGPEGLPFRFTRVDI